MGFNSGFEVLKSGKNVMQFTRSSKDVLLLPEKINRDKTLSSSEKVSSCKNGRGGINITKSFYHNNSTKENKIVAFPWQFIILTATFVFYNTKETYYLLSKATMFSSTRILIGHSRRRHKFE